MDSGICIRSALKNVSSLVTLLENISKHVLSDSRQPEVDILNYQPVVLPTFLVKYAVKKVKFLINTYLVALRHVKKEQVSNDLKTTLLNLSFVFLRRRSG